MAEVKRLKDRRSDLAVFQVSGNVTCIDVCHLLDTSIATESTLHLFDFRWASLAALSKADIKAQIRTAVSKIRPGARAAFVFSNPADLSVGRLINKSTGGGGHRPETREFYNPYLARDWLLFCSPLASSRA